MTNQNTALKKNGSTNQKSKQERAGAKGGKKT